MLASLLSTRLIIPVYNATLGWPSGCIGAGTSAQTNPEPLMSDKPLNIYRHEREQRHRAYLNTRPLRDEFPRIGRLTLQLTFTDESRLSSYSAQMRTFAPAANAFFEIPCPSTVCIGGGFDLGSVVWNLSNRAASETSGIVVCQGHTGTDERDPRSCALQLHYHVSVVYLGSPQLADLG